MGPHVIPSGFIINSLCLPPACSELACVEQLPGLGEGRQPGWARGGLMSQLNTSQVTQVTTQGLTPKVDAPWNQQAEPGRPRQLAWEQKGGDYSRKGWESSLGIQRPSRTTPMRTGGASPTTELGHLQSKIARASCSHHEPHAQPAWQSTPTATLYSKWGGGG